MALPTTRMRQLRRWRDANIVSHVFFVPAVAVCVWRGAVLELAALQSVVMALSVLNHRNYERPGVLSVVEGLAAKSLFVYGVAQTAQSPSAGMLGWNCACATMTMAIWLLQLAVPRLWDPWHWIGLHLVPGLWSAGVALFHDAIWV